MIGRDGSKEMDRVECVRMIKIRQVLRTVMMRLLYLHFLMFCKIYTQDEVVVL